MAKKKSESVIQANRQKSNLNLEKKYRLSRALAAFVGSNVASRPHIIKKLWEYIKKAKLQAPSDKRYIIPDRVLWPIFGVYKFHGFYMTGLMTVHLTPL